jgi:hypothetical protein
MSMTTKQKKAFAAWATATAALGLLTGPALAQATPMIPLGVGCTQYQLTGNFAFNQSNGYSVSFPSTGTTASGTATATPGGNTGTVSGWVEGRTIHFRISWREGGDVGSYTGFVDDNGFASGSTTDILNSKYASWNSTVPLGCVTPTPLPGTDQKPNYPVSVTPIPLPGTDQKPNYPVPVTPIPLPGTDQKPNYPVPVTTPATPLPGTDRKPNYPVPVTATPTPLPGTDRKPKFPVP